MSAALGRRLAALEKREGDADPFAHLDDEALALLIEILRAQASGDVERASLLWSACSDAERADLERAVAIHCQEVC